MCQTGLAPLFSIIQFLMEREELMEENNLEENLDSAPEKRSRELLDALPSFDEDQFSATTSDGRQSASADETVIVTHEGEAAEEDAAPRPSTGSFWSTAPEAQPTTQISVSPSDDVQESNEGTEQPSDPFETTVLNVENEIDLPETPVSTPVDNTIDEKADEEQALNTLVTAPLTEQPDIDYAPSPLASEPIAEGAYSYETNYTQEVASGESRSGGKVLKRVLIALLAFVFPKRCFLCALICIPR